MPTGRPMPCEGNWVDGVRIIHRITTLSYSLRMSWYTSSESMIAPLNVKTIQYNENQFFPKIFNLLPLSIIAQIETTAAQMIHWPCQKVYKRPSSRNAADPKQKRKKGLGKNASFGRTPQLVFINHDTRSFVPTSLRATFPPAFERCSHFIGSEITCCLKVDCDKFHCFLVKITKSHGVLSNSDFKVLNCLQYPDFW